MDIDRKQIMAAFLRTLGHIADIKYQERIWICGEGPEVDDFDETVNFFFDLGDPILKDYKSYGMSEDQYKLLAKFREAFETFADAHYHPLEFITSPEWKTIMAMAKEVLKAFNYIEQT